MPMLADPADLEDIPGLDLVDFTAGELRVAVEQATSQIIGELGWDPIESERTYKVRDVVYGVPIYLPAQHVTAVEVAADGADLEVLADWWDENGRLDLDRYVRRGVVTFTAGWFAGDETGPSEIPQALRDACLTLASQLLHNPERLTSKSIGPFSRTYVDGEGPVMSSPPQYRILAIA